MGLISVHPEMDLTGFEKPRDRNPGKLESDLDLKGASSLPDRLIAERLLLRLAGKT